MQSWMIGTVAGLFAPGWLPELPAREGCYALLLFSLLVLLLRRNGITWLLLGIATGGVWSEYRGASLLEQRLPPQLEGQVLLLRGTVVEPPQLRRFTGGGQRQRFPFAAQGRTCTADGLSCTTVLRRVLLSYYGSGQFRVGQRWELQVRLKRPWGLANPGSFNYQSWLAQNRFGATGSVREGHRVLLSEAVPRRLLHQQWRQSIALALTSQFRDHPALGVLNALSIGDRSAISSRAWERFQQYGLNHLVVISGLHVGLVAGLGYLLGQGMGAVLSLLFWRINGRQCGRMVAIVCAGVYSAMAGFGLPTQRALIMLASVQLLSMGGRRLSGSNALLLALLGVGVLDPLATHSAGFWLSFLAVALIFYLRICWPDMNGWRFILAMQAVLSLGLGLLSSTWFGGASWIAPLANLVAVPVVSLLLAPLCLLAALAWHTWPTLAELLWAAAAMPVTAFLSLSETLAMEGVSFWVQHSPAPMALLFAGAGLLLLLAPQGVPWRILSPIFLLPLLFPVHDRLSVGEMEVTVLDVGQGLSVLVRTREARLLYDTGAGDPAGPNMATAVILPYLRHQKVGPLDVLVLSHADNDHASGGLVLQRDWPVDRIWAGQPERAPELLSAPCLAGNSGRLGALRWWQLQPVATRFPDVPSANNRSCVLMLDFYGFRVLLPGDIERKVELELARSGGGQIKADLLVAPHHGSATSSSAPFLNKVRPAIAVFAAGYHNRFGHPHPAVVDRYRRRGSRVFNTADSGALTFRVVHGRLASISRWRDKKKFYWH
jgi:competence protein ComEC